MPRSNAAAGVALDRMLDLLAGSPHGATSFTLHHAHKVSLETMEEAIGRRLVRAEREPVKGLATPVVRLFLTAQGEALRAIVRADA